MHPTPVKEGKIELGFGAVGLRLAAQSRQQLLFVFSGTGQIAADGPDISVGCGDN